MRRTSKPQAQLVSEPTLHPTEVALLERFRRLKDKQKSFALRVFDLMLSNEAARPRLKAEHVVLAVTWRVKGDRPFKTVEKCTDVWENPTGPKVEITDPFAGQMVPIEDPGAPGET